MLIAALHRIVGTWVTEATHPAMPDVVVHGTADVAWLEGERFVIHRTRADHPEFPDSISILGDVDRDRVDGAPEAVGRERLHMHYFDSRGVFRDYRVNVDERAWLIWRNAPGFSQRFTGTFAEDGDAIAGLWEVSEDGEHWSDDLQITYRRRR